MKVSSRPGRQVRRLALGLALLAGVGATIHSAPASAAVPAPRARHPVVSWHADASPNAALIGWTIQSIGPGTCLDANPTAWNNDPGRPWLWGCSGAQQQHWYAAGWQAGGNGTSEVRVVGPPYGPANKCLDAWPEPGYPWGYRVTTWTCNGGPQQEWTVNYVDGTDSADGYYITNGDWPGCLYTIPGPGGSAVNGGYIGLGNCETNGDPEYWNITG